MGNVPEVVNKNLAAVEQILVNSQEQLAAVLPKQIGLEKFIYVALDLVKANSMLAKCEPASILQATLEAAELGLLLTKNLGHGYLVPYRNGALSEKLKRDVYECQFQIGYRGFLNLVREADPEVGVIYSRIVWPGEDFQIDEDHHRILHAPNPEGGTVIVNAQSGETSGYRGVYAKVLYGNGAQDFDWMPLHEVEKIRRSSKARSEDSPWRRWPEEMIKKSPMRRLCKRLKLTPEKLAGVVRDEYRELGVEQQGSLERPRMQMPRRLSQQTVTVPAEPVAAPTETTDYSKDIPPPCPKCGEETRLIAPGQKGTFKWGFGWGCKKKCAKGAWVDAKEHHEREALRQAQAAKAALEAQVQQPASPAREPGDDPFTLG